MKLPQLKSLVKQINERPGSTVMFPLGSKGLKTREEIIGLISGCQGKHTKVKSQFEFLSLDELRKKPLAELKLMVKKMTDRQPDEFKTESSYHRWSLSHSNLPTHTLRPHSAHPHPWKTLP